MMLKLLHTANWHLGMGFGQFDEDAQRKLTRARLEVIDKILGLADQYAVDAVLCAGDLFDGPDPGVEWWEGLLKAFNRRAGWTRPVFLLPGNHDPLISQSVYHAEHPFRRGLPAWVHVVDRHDFTYELRKDAVLHAVPCTSPAGQADPTLRIPARAPEDARLRIGLVHGQTFDIEGHETNFPIGRDAAQRCGLDYLAIGDAHDFREVQPNATAPTVYPGAPEPSSFKERDAGSVALVSLSRSGRRPQLQAERVGRWTWRHVVCTDLGQLRKLRAEDLVNTVLKLELRMTVSLKEHEEAQQLVAELEGTSTASGRAGVLLLDRAGLKLEIGASAFPDDLPAVLGSVVDDLTKRTQDEAQAATARRALLHLYRLVKEKA